MAVMCLPLQCFVVLMLAFSPTGYSEASKARQLRPDGSTDPKPRNHPPQVAKTRTNSSKIIACYYANTLLNETDIDPHLCSHIIFGSALISPQGVVARNHSDIYSWRLLVKLKEKNPDLKILVSACCNFDTVLGKGPEVLARFVEGTRQLLRAYNLDGIDLDFEFPGLLKRNEFFELEKGLSAMLRSEGKLLSAALPHDLLTFIESYYTEAVNTYFDFMTVMTYDYSRYTSSRPYTDYNSPLSKASSIIGQLTSIAGVQASKLLIGYPTYGYSWKLANASHHGRLSLSVGPGDPGPYLKSRGYSSLPDVCLEVKQGGTIVVDEDNMAEYMYRGDTWISFNGMYSAKREAEYVLKSGIGGVGFFALHFADFKNICGYGPFPVFNTVKSILSQS